MQQFHSPASRRIPDTESVMEKNRHWNKDTSGKYEAFKKLDALSDGEDEATLILKDGKQIKLKYMKPTAGDEIVLDTRALYLNDQVLLFDPGFNSTASCASAITYVDGDKGKCYYRGYDVSALVRRHDYLDVAYLLLHGELPETQERRIFEEVIKDEMLVHTRIKEFISTFVPGAHPMSILSSVLSAMASFYADPMEQRYMQDKSIRDMACARLIAKIPTVVAMSYKVLIGQPMVYPRADLTYAENFLYMMFATPTAPFTVNSLHAEVIDTFLCIHADHEQNASTSTVRTAGSSLANPYACIATGVTSLWGRAHGGANEAVIDMLEEIGKPENVAEFIEAVIRRERRLMGFGHRIYKNTDPRSQIMQELCHKVFAQMTDPDRLFYVAKELEAQALKHEYFIRRKLYPNVDFYSGIVMRALRIPKEMFTVLFAMGRTVGWLSHWKEMVEERQIKITRPRQLYIGDCPRLLPGEKRISVVESENKNERLLAMSKNNNAPYNLKLFDHCGEAARDPGSMAQPSVDAPTGHDAQAESYSEAAGAPANPDAEYVAKPGQESGHPESVEVEEIAVSEFVGDR